MSWAKKVLKKSLAQVGVKLNQPVRESIFPVECSQAEIALIKRVRDNRLTMGSFERLFATTLACKHIAANKIDGDFVECGVWRGGHSILAASLFKLLGHPGRIYMFDTFQGMVEPTSEDVELLSHVSASEKFDELTNRKDGWCLASLEDVRANCQSLGVADRVTFIEGDVGVTLDDVSRLPDRIAILRLDTDWYESTKKELEVLYPRLVPGGILIVDDYGHWAGSKQAVDEYFEKHGNRPFLQYNDYTGRCGIKP